MWVYLILLDKVRIVRAPGSDLGLSYTIDRVRIVRAPAGDVGLSYTIRQG